MGSTSTESAVPSSIAAAVLTPSHEMPKGSQKVEELDFNEFTSRPITVEDLISGMNHMGFQASSISEAVRIINDMVCAQPLSLFQHITLCYYKFIKWISRATDKCRRENGETWRLVMERQYFLVTRLI